MGGLLARFGLIGAVLFGGWLFRDYLTGAAIDLEVGDCFDAPTTISEAVEEVAHHPCTDAHTAEVFFVADYPDGAFPGEDGFDAFIEANCIPAFTAYTGLDWATAEEYDIGWFEPTPDGWSSGDHEMTCYVVKVDSSTMTSSLRAQ